MSRIFTLLLFIALFGNVSAQNWQPFNEFRSYYECTDSVLTEEPTISLIPGEIISSSIGSPSNNSGITTYRPQKLVGCDLLDGNIQLANNMESCSDLFAWNGSTIETQNNQWKVKNRDSNWVNLPSGLDSSISIFTIADTNYSLELIATQESIVLGDTDSVAIFQISVFDSFGHITSNIWFGDTVILSKNHGLIQSPAWYLFPNYKAALELIDQNGIGRFKGFSFDFFQSYNEGTQLETKTNIERGYGMFNDIYLISKSMIKQQCTLNQITPEPNLGYKFDCKVQTDKYIIELAPNGNPFSIITGKNSYYSDSTFWIYKADFEAFEFLKGKIYNPLNSHQLIQNIQSENFPQNDSCKYYQNIEFPSGDLRQKKWEQHIGMVRKVNNYFPPGGGYYDVFEYNITYFKSDSVEYGTPGWPIGINEILPINEVLIYPNPVENVLHLQHSENILAAKLYSISGDLLFEATQEQLAQKALDFSELPKGIYLLKVQLADHSETHRIVK